MTASVKPITGIGTADRLERLKLQMMATETSLLVGRRLQQARKEAGMRQRDVAEAMGIDPPLDAQRISDWERGVNLPGERNMAALAEALGKERAWFYMEDEPQPGNGDLMGALSGTSQLDRIEARLNQLAEDLQAMREDAAQGRVRAAGERETLLQLLAEPAQPDAEPPADTPVVSPPRRRATGA